MTFKSVFNELAKSEKSLLNAKWITPSAALVPLYMLSMCFRRNIFNKLAKKMGLSVYTIRFYEKEGLLDNRHVQREKNNYRNYRDEAVERLKLKNFKA